MTRTRAAATSMRLSAVVAIAVSFAFAAEAQAAKPKVSIKDATVVEPAEASDTANAVFRIVLSKKSDDAVKVSYDTGSGTASPGDYVPDSGVVKIKAGKKSAKLNIQVHGDDEMEVAEQFGVSIYDAVGAKIDDGSATGTITDSD